MWKDIFKTKYFERSLKIDIKLIMKEEKIQLKKRTEKLRFFSQISSFASDCVNLHKPGAAFLYTNAIIFF